MKKLALITLLALAAAGCNTDEPPEAPPSTAKKQDHQPRQEQPRQEKPRAESCRDCGTVVAVRAEKREGEGGAVGIVAGAAAGGLIGKQFGNGDGKKAMTVAGALGGAFVGNEVQKHVTAKEVWVTQVKMNDGKMRNFEHEKQPAWKSGQLVRVGANNSVVAVVNR
jgi:outer membrane lipoprotein SlyB